MTEEPELPFEAAVTQLERIVEALEQGEPELAAALAKYEAGVRLLSQCYALLERSERSVSLLTDVDAQGKPISTPFDATATHEAKDVRGSASGSTGGGEVRASGATKTPRIRRTKPATDPDLLDPPF